MLACLIADIDIRGESVPSAGALFDCLKLHLAWSYVRCSFKESNRRSNYMKGKDIRTLCYPCFSDYHNAGYKMVKLNKPKGRCDKCGRQGMQYWLKPIPKK